MRQSLDSSDRLVVRKNLEISELNSRLAIANQKISERDEEIENLESDLANEKNKSSPTDSDFSELEAADLLNRLKARRKKSRADLVDVETLLEIVSSES